MHEGVGGRGDGGAAAPQVKRAEKQSTPNAKLGSPKMMLSKGKYFAKGQVSVICNPVAVRINPGTPRASARPSMSSVFFIKRERPNQTSVSNAAPAATAMIVL